MTLNYHDNILHSAAFPLTGLAERFGTPLYVYNQHQFIRAVRQLDGGLAGPTPHLICYAIKANPTLAVIQTFARLGLGADITSGGELYRALQAGIPANQIVYSGVGKTPNEMRQALEANIRSFHVESAGELQTLGEVAASMGRVATVALRVNPDIDPHTHPHIATGLRDTKFGIPWDQVTEMVEEIQRMPPLKLCGLSVHIGSQITKLGPFEQAAERLVALARELLFAGVPLDYLDLGGGLGVRYQDETPPPLVEWGNALRSVMGGLPLTLLVEPGRALVAESGILVTRVLNVKQSVSRTFVVVDAGMNDFLRPILYGVHHPIWPVEPHSDAPERMVDIVGPVCESTDVFARDQSLPLPRPGDLLAVLHAGAYGSSMASNYNSRCRPAEVMITEDGESRLIRTRETYADLMKCESLLP